MLKYKIVCIAICMAVLSLKVSYAGSLPIVRNGKPQATIVIAEDASNYQKWAAQWLRDYVKTSSGAALPIVVESNAPAGALISVGHTKMAKKAGITTDDLKYDGCKRVVKGNVLYLIGRDSARPDHKRPLVHISGAQGTVRAVAMFVEDIIGVRWFTPGPHGTVLPKKKNISVGESEARTFSPAIGYVRGRSYYHPAIALIANNFRIAVNYLGYGGHSWEVHVDDKEYFDEHPEYFALLPNGKRSRAKYSKATGLLTRNAHLCTSNMEVRQIIVDKMRILFDQGYDMIQLGQSDSWAACVCPECMKLDKHVSGQTVNRNNPCEKIWTMHGWILEELYKSHPDKLVNVLVYGPTAWPSRKIKSLPPNAVMEMAPINNDRLDAWQGKIKYLTTYMYWFEDNCQKSAFVPPLSPEWLQKTLRRYRNLGVMGIKSAPRINWGLGGPSYYAYGKLTGDPDADIDKMLHEYCMGIYEEAGPTMKRFFKLFHSRSGKTMDMPYFRSSYPAEDAFTALYQPKVIHEMDRLLRLAEARAKSEQAKGWVKHTRDCFDGLKTVAEMFAAKQTFEGYPSRDTLLRVKMYVNAVEDWRERILSYDKAYTDEWFPEYLPMAGFLMTGGFNSMYDEYYYGRTLARKHQEAVRAGKKKVRGTGMGGNLGHHDISAPITWDFDRVMLTLGKEKQEKKITVVPVVKPMLLDGEIGPEWQGVAAHPFVGYYSEATKIHEGATTSVRVMYGEEELYVAYECVEPNIDKLKIESVGHDGDVYHHDEVELFLNTDESSNRKVIQFAASPIENAFYDARKGFVDDPLDPNYTAWDVVAWNPKWRYAWKVDKAAKKWTLEMAVPYASLGVPKPADGTVWTGNFGRCRRVHGSEDLSGWVSGTFGSDPTLFGKLEFSASGEKKKVAVKTAKPITPKSVPAQAKAVKSVTNGSFEGLKKGKPVRWSLYSYPPRNAPELMRGCGVTTEMAHSGKRSVKLDLSSLTANEIKKAREVLVGQVVYGGNLKPLLGKKAVFTMWVCYDSLCPPHKAGYFPGPWFDFVAHKKGGTRVSLQGTNPIILNRPYFAPQGYTTDGQIIGKWLKVETKIEVPVDTKSLSIRIGVQAWRPYKETVDVNTTAVYIDDISLAVTQE